MVEETLFTTALERAPAERSRYLDQVCGGDTALRRRVEALLCSHEKAGRFLESPPLELALPNEPAVNPAANLPWKRLGDYRIVRLIGHGGMGEVYEAMQEPLGRRVALKILSISQRHDARALERFRREAKTAASLHHTNIVPVFGVGESAGVHYYAMQYIEGVGLDDVLRDLKRRRIGSKTPTRQDASQTSGEWCKGHSKQIPPDAADTGTSTPLSSSSGTRTFYREVARVGIQAADALDYGHRQGVLHRDVKPSNLLLDKANNLWITDFGLAKQIGSGGSDNGSDLTRTGDVVGTLRYMAPERFAGKADCTSDVYALGTTLYELLTLHAAFDEEDQLRLLNRLQHGPPPAPPRTLDSNIPHDLETIILKAMALHTEDRYASAVNLADDLRRFLADEPIRARPATTVERCLRWCRRKPALAGLAITLLVALVALVVTGVTVGYNVRLQAAVKEADEQRHEADRQRGRAEKLEARVSYARAVNLIYQYWDDSRMAQARELLDDWRPGPDRLYPPGWEWHFLNRLCHQEERTILPGGPMHRVALSPDGRWLAIIATLHASQIQIWDARTLERVHTLAGHQGQVHGVVFRPDSRHLITSSWDKQVILWDVQTGKRLTNLPNSKPAQGLACSADGKWLAIGHEDGTVDVLETEPWKLRYALAAHTTWALGLAFHPDSKVLATSGRDGLIKLWELATGSQLVARKAHTGVIFDVAFDPKGTLLASAGEDGFVRLWDVASLFPLLNMTGGQPLKTLEGHAGMVRQVAFRPDGKQLASCGDDRTIRIWDIASGQEAKRLRGHTHFVTGLTYLADGQRLVSSSLDGAVKVWNMATGLNEAGKLLDLHEPIAALALSPDGQFLICGQNWGAIYLFDAVGGNRLWRSQGHAGDVHSLAFHPDGERLASSGRDQQIVLWDRITGHNLRTFGKDLGKVHRIGIHPDGARLFSGHDGGVCRIWDIATGKQLGQLNRGNAPIWDVAFSPDGSKVATISHEVTVWDTATLQTVVTFPGAMWRRFSGAFSPDGRLLAVASPDGVAQIFDLATGREKASLLGHADHVVCLAFHPDGCRLATGSSDRTVKIWDVDTGMEMLTIRGFNGGQYGLTFSPDGNRLMVCGAFSDYLRVLDATPLANPKP
jgi:WD40 repeat protein/serine/threonine protein kinase